MTPRGVITLFRNSVFDVPNNKTQERQIRCPKVARAQLSVANGAARPARPQRTPFRIAAEPAARGPDWSKDSCSHRGRQGFNG